jgi:hypothetical protein
MTNTTTDVVQNNWICSFCGKTNDYEFVCGGCITEQPLQSQSKSEIGTSGLIEVNTNHECATNIHHLDFALIVAVLSGIAIGSIAALIKNRKKGRYNSKSAHETSVQGLRN